nr:hypothetical protein [Candidatus Njordarchaeum guaymaensis]
MLFGDAVLDTQTGIAILSVDQIISYLSKILTPSLVIVGTDTNGLFTADPKLNPRATLIPEISSKNRQDVLKGLGGAQRVEARWLDE